MNSHTDILLLDKNMLDEATEVLLAAFKNEAFTAAWLDLSNARLWKLYSRAVRLKLKLYLSAGHPVYIAAEKRRVLGILVLKSPHIVVPWKSAACLLLPNLHGLIGLIPNFIHAFRLGGAMKPPSNLPQNHYILEAIGVDPSCQGKGVGRLLLEQAEKICFDDKRASGIYLFTGDEPNRIIYEKLGYKLLETRQTGTFTAYHMFYCFRTTGSHTSER